MIDVPVQVFFKVDEVAQIGVLDGKFAKFENNVFVGYISVEEVVDKYIECGARIPDDFVAIREIVAQKLTKLQSLL